MIDSQKTGDFIKEARKAKGLSQNELADMLNISRVAVSKWENGHNMPDISTMELLGEILDVDVEELIKGEYIERSQPEVKKNYVPVVIVTLVVACLIGLLNIRSYIAWDEYNMGLYTEVVYSVDDLEEKAGLMFSFVHDGEQYLINNMDSRTVTVRDDKGNTCLVVVVSCYNRGWEKLFKPVPVGVQTVVSYYRYEELNCDLYGVAYYRGNLNKFAEEMTLEEFNSVINGKEGSYCRFFK